METILSLTHNIQFLRLSFFFARHDHGNQLLSPFLKTFTFSRFYFLRTPYSQKPCIVSYSHNFHFLLSFAFYITKSTFVSLFHNFTFLRMFLLNVVGVSFISINNFSHLRLCPSIFVMPPVE